MRRKCSPGIPGGRTAGIITAAGIIIIFSFLSSCEKFIHPNQDLILESEEMFSDWSEYVSAEMGLYSIQQDLVEQLLVLGELRGDLLQLTENATPDLREVNNFEIQKDNPYASPVKFFRLISACNDLIRQLKFAHPEVMDKNEPITNFDRLYGEVLCMRAWAYFNAVRIYGKIPYIYESLSTVDEIQAYVNSGGTYIDSVFIDFDRGGFYNDTIRDTVIILEKKYLNEQAVIDTFTVQLENQVKVVGINHSINNGDISWQVTIWNEMARHVLLGQMYLFDGNYVKAMEHFNPILYNSSSETSNIKYGLDKKLARGSWGDIFRTIDIYEHIYMIWFGKSQQQENEIQTMFSLLGSNTYMMKPTPTAVRYWESIWNDPVAALDNDYPERSRMEEPGVPGDFYRGYGVSYKYYENGEALSNDTVSGMLQKKLKGNHVELQLMMNDVDTVVNKYSIGKYEFSHDAHFIIYRAAGVHLYAAEIYALWEFDHGGLVRPETNTSLNILNDGSYNNTNAQLGVRGRVGFSDGYEAVRINNIIYQHDPETNEIIGFKDYTGDLSKKQEYLVDRILDERARELAFEGERFYDLMRIARRRDDPAYLADRIAAKFSGAKKETIRQFLMNEENWYIDFF